MGYLTGKDYDKCITLDYALNRCFDRLGYVKTGVEFCNTGESDFFSFTFWKKGTIHITFKDVKLWEEFNYRACSGKNFLPEEELKRDRTYA